MTMPGSGCFVAIHNVRAGRTGDYAQWHTHEHMIERLAIPGFLRGLRYRALTDAPALCTIYQVESLATLTSPAYLARLNDPTPWTIESIPLGIDMQKTFCTVAASHGHGVGGFLGILQLAPRAEAQASLDAWLSGDTLAALSRQAGLCGAHALIGDDTASRTKAKERDLRDEAATVADWIVLVEGYDRVAVEAAITELAAPGGTLAASAHTAPTRSLYALEFTLDADGDLPRRPAP